ncbi:MAG: FHA domain-containing protein [Anaerolineae bacterium]
MKITKVRLLLFLLSSLLLAGSLPAAGQTETALRIVKVDVSRFPLVRLNLITTDGRSAPVADLSSLSLRENGVPVADVKIQSAPVGVDLFIVIDANDTILNIDDNSGLTRSEKVKESLIRLASQFMNPNGLDRVSIFVPNEDGETSRLLVEDVTQPKEVILAVQDYAPAITASPPLEKMMEQAIEHAVALKGSRYQAVLLFTDGARLDQQLSFAALVAQAQAIDLPIYVAILGARADPNEVENAARLHTPTRGTYVHMPAAAGADPIYTIWQQQGEQIQLLYRSLQTRSGQYAITLNLGEVRASAELDLKLAPPELTVLPEQETIRRVGDDWHSLLSSLEPKQVQAPVAVNWPDGIPRRLKVVTLLVNGRVESILSSDSLVQDEAGNLLIPWDIQNLDNGSYSLVVQVTDELSFAAESRPAPVSIVTERPLPPTPTAVPTPLPPGPGIREAATNMLPLLSVVGAAALALMILRWYRHRPLRLDETILPTAAASAPYVIEPTAPASVDDAPMAAFLELQGDTLGGAAVFKLEGESMTVGRDEIVAQIVLEDENVSRLHALIKKSGQEYWLYDEGSAAGTFLNYQRLGLSPRLLRDRDLVHIGHVPLQFRLRPVHDLDEEE